MASVVTNVTVGTFLTSMHKRSRKVRDEFSALYRTTRQTRGVHPLEAYCNLK